MFTHVYTVLHSNSGKNHNYNQDIWHICNRLIQIFGTIKHSNNIMDAYQTVFVNTITVSSGHKQM